MSCFTSAFAVLGALGLGLTLTVPRACAQTNPPAFPGAVGFGAYATGGRAGTVYPVTTLADSGAGSFRAAVGSANRIVVFNVGGYISLLSEVSVANNITIAGQTAPGRGIAIRGAEVSLGTSTNIIIRHVRFRPGSSADSGAHCVNIRGTNAILDQVSLEFGPWNNVGGNGANLLTIQRSFIADPIGQRFGAHMERTGGRCTWYQNLFANAHGRQPLAKINTVFINNVVYNYQAAYDCGDTSGVFSHDVVSNYFITGPATTSAGNNFYQLNLNQSFYASGNLRDSDEDGVLDGTTTSPSGVIVLDSPWSQLTPTIPTVTAATAFRRNLSLVGAWPRDQVDNVILNEVRSVGVAGPYPLPSSQTVTGLGNNGFGTINGGVAPLDTDQDGMPDYWEVSTGSNPNSSDAMVIGADGYAKVEQYLNWLAEPHALTTTNAAIDIDLWPYTAGFTNASPTYYLDSATNGTVSLVSGHLARFTPTPDFAGLASFRFAVVSSDGLSFTNTLVVLVSSLPPPRNLIWRGDGASNTWDVGGPTNWHDDSSLVAFSSGDNVTFDDSGSNSPAINLTGSITAGTVSVVAEQDYTFGGAGALIGSTALYKVGAGKLILNNLNTFIGGTTINEGIVQLGDGATISGNLTGGITNNDQLIFANPTALTSSATIGGSGTVTKTGVGVLTLSGSQSYTNLTTISAGALEFSGTPPLGDINNDALLTFKPSTSATYAGSISGSGAVKINASGQTVTLSSVSAYTGGTTNTAGTLQLGNDRAAGLGPVTYLSGAVKVGSGVVITNTFVLPSSTADLMLDTYGGGTATWAGSIVATGGGASFRPGGTDGRLALTGTAALGGRNFIIPKGSVEIAGNASFSAAGTATAFGRNKTANSAFVTLKNNATVALGRLSLGGGQSTGGRVTVTLQDNASLSTGTESFDLHNSTRTATWTMVTLNGGVLTVGGFVKTMTGATQFSTNNFNGGILGASKDNASFLPALSALTTHVQAGGVKVDDNGFAITIAQPLLHDPALGTTPDGGLTKLGSGTLTLSGANTYDGPTTILGGTLALSGAGSIAASPNIYVALAAMLNVSALGGFSLGSGKKLWGNGSVAGNFTLASGAVLEPGTIGIGALDFANNLTLAAGSTNRFELDRSTRTNDAVNVAGTLTFGGALIVTKVGDDLQANDSFTLYKASGFAGGFDLVILPALKARLAWNTNQLDTAGVLSVLNTAPPVFGSVTLSGGGLVMSGSHGTANASYCVLTSTNVALPMIHWTCLATNQFAGDGTFVFTNPIPPEVPVSFYRLQLP